MFPSGHLLLIVSTSRGQGDGLVDGTACYLTKQLVFYPGDSHSGRRDLTSSSCPLMSI